MLSVILCTYNRERYIYPVLESIARGEYEDYEIVLVDNNSQDNTRFECERFCKDHPDIATHYIFEPQQGLSHARNTGIRHAKGNILVYVDDDALVNTAYLKTYADFFAKHPEAMAAGGPILPQYDGCEEPKWMSHYTRQLITGKLYLGKCEREFPAGHYPGGGNAAYRKEVFELVGTFNVDLGRKGDSLIGAEEKDLFDKMTTRGIRFFYLPSAVLYHLIPPRKLTDEYFDRLTRSIGQSERYRTLAISRAKYAKRLLAECVKWGATLLLWTGFLLKLQACKGHRLVRFRRNVTLGLLSSKNTNLNTSPSNLNTKP